jgi:hypothetical protein
LIKNFPNDRLLIEFCVPKLQITEKHDIVEGKKPKENKKLSDDLTLPKILNLKEKEINKEKEKDNKDIDKDKDKDKEKEKESTNNPQLNEEKKKTIPKFMKFEKSNKEKQEDSAPFIPSGSNFE